MGLSPQRSAFANVRQKQYQLQMVSRTVHDKIPSEEEARHIQELGARSVSRDAISGNVRIVAGVDVAYRDADDLAIAAACLLDAQSLEVIGQRIIETNAPFPYTPGLFSLTEAPPILAALDALDTKPDLIVCDGHGIAHPRRFGLASHLGVMLDIPTIGCAKTRLTGTFEPPGKKRGDWSPLTDDGEVIGAVLRTQDGVKPVFVSIGHKVSLEDAIAWVLSLSPRYRLPETTRTADHAVRMALKNRAQASSCG